MGIVKAVSPSHQIMDVTTIGENPESFRFVVPCQSITPGQHVAVRINENDGNKVHPPNAKVDRVSLGIALHYEGVMQGLYDAWMSSFLSERTNVYMAEEIQIENEMGRFHVSGFYHDMLFAANRIMLRRSVPEAIKSAYKLQNLRALIDHPAIPTEAVITDIISIGEDRTNIYYDVQDITMSEVFGRVQDHVFRPAD